MQQPCAKAKEFGEAEFWDGLPVFLWRDLVGVSSRRTGCVLNREGLCVKELNLLLQLPQDVSTRYRSVDMTVLAAFAISFCQRHCVSLCKGTKAAKSCAFCDCTPEFYGGILFLLLESKGNCAFKKAAKICFLKAGKL